jgi:phenylacetic acid degradation operon negative regulatory protein
MRKARIVKGKKRPQRAASLIFTLYGDFAGKRREGKVWVGGLIRLMAQCGLSAAAVRQALSRMVAQRWLRSEKKGGLAYYSLTDRGARRVEQIAPRIYEPAAEWDGRWRLVVYNFAESRRENRDRLRKDLALLGLAPLSPAIWISPRDLRAEILELASQPALHRALHLFVGYYEGLLSDRELLERCWDLSAIAAAYGEFIAFYEPRLAAERRTNALSDERAFVERLQLVQDFRRFLYVDPGLPSALLPAHWPGTKASALFREYYALIAAKAERFFAGSLLILRPRAGASDSRHPHR